VQPGPDVRCGRCIGVHGEVALTGPRDCRGDVGYIPQGCGHSIENVGSGPARILIGFNAGIYETIEPRNGSRKIPRMSSPRFSASRRNYAESSPDRDVVIAAKEQAR
jgi:oxalate decarboxylase